MFGDAEPLEDSDPESVDLGYPLGMAFDLWAAWNDHHTLPYSGGYLEQPRRWLRMIHLMNRRYHFANAQARAEHRPPTPDEDPNEDALDGFFDAPFDPSGAAQASWEQFGSRY